MPLNRPCRSNLIDAPVVHLPDVKPDTPQPSGAIECASRAEPPSTSVVRLLRQRQTPSLAKGLNETDWTQTNGPYGGRVEELFRASDGTLYAVTGSSGVFRSSNGGDLWVPINNGLDGYVDGSMPVMVAITEAKGVLYLSTTAGVLLFNQSG